jgi:hypothetical protein
MNRFELKTRMVWIFDENPVRSSSPFLYVFRQFSERGTKTRRSFGNQSFSGSNV